MTTDSTAEIDAHAFSTVGKVREDNQDALSGYTAPDGEARLYAVADGMGGYEHGGIASSLALETLIGIVNMQQGSIESMLRRGIQDANLAVYQKAINLQARMGTTLTAVYMQGAQLYLAHVGDSRAYLIHDGKATCLTNDHTGVGEMVRARILSPDKVRTHSQRSILNRSLGMQMIVQPDISRARITSGDVLILCSDGLWSAIEDDQIAALADPQQSAETISQRLVAAALDNDSDDNVSAWAICARHVPNAAVPEPSRRWSLPALLRGRSRA